MKLIENYPLKALTTFGIGGRAKYFVSVSTTHELQEAIRFCFQKKLRYFILGKGSNTLFDDRGFDGVVILNKIQGMDEQPNGQLKVGAGYSFSLLGSQTARQGKRGLEFASGIPGTVGGAVFMNAGASGSETFQPLVEVTWINEEGEIGSLKKEEIQWGYRWTMFHHKKGAIAAACFQLENSVLSSQKQKELIRYRIKTQPYSDLSAGCVFRNPSGQLAGQLIEQAGLKGAAIGGAEVSMLHANFIVNKGSATARDVVQLIQEVQNKVRDQTGHFLETEIRLIPYEDLG